MNKKNVIIISVLVNAGLLLVLFISALTSSKEEVVQASSIAKEPQFAGSEQILGEVKGGNISQGVPAVATAPLSASTTLVENKATETSLAVNASSTTTNVLGNITTDSTTQVALPQVAAADGVKVVEDIVHPIPQLEESSASVATAPSSTATSNTIEVKVKKGDSLERIAKVHRVTVRELIKLNQLPNTFLKVGQIILVPKNSNVSKFAATATKSKTSKGKYYTVKCGDSLWTIAMKHKMKTNELLRLNKMTAEDSKRLRPGMKLKVS